MKIRFKSKDTKDQAQNGIPGAAPRSFSRGRLAFSKRSWHQTQCEKTKVRKRTKRALSIIIVIKGHAVRGWLIGNRLGWLKLSDSFQRNNCGA
jgi:hypothetical protein